MTYYLGQSSVDKLDGVDPRMVAIVNKVMSYQIVDFKVQEGLRTLEKQKEYLKAGTTQTLKSKHLPQENGFGWAVDLYPHPIDMKRVRAGDYVEIVRFGVLAGLMFRAAQELGHEIRWGADWDKDGQTLDHTLFDAPHFELI